MNKYFRLWNTVKYLKATQIYFRLYYAIRAKIRKISGFRYEVSKSSKASFLILHDSIPSMQSYQDGVFEFLNLRHTFDAIDWNYHHYGKLWTYNLTYFEYLNQKNLDSKRGIELIYDFMHHMPYVKDGLEPFPISLRGVNWIKFLIANGINNQKINDNLYAQYTILVDKLEYHLLGNHLLENGFSLLFGAYYFQDEFLYLHAQSILSTELNEQILADGAHFELSPMYHQLMLFRLLDCVNLVMHNEWRDRELLAFLSYKASIMLGWLHAMSYRDGSIPCVNDSSIGIAPSTIELLEYASRLNVKRRDILLSASGYRKIEHEHYECLVDIGAIGASYIPGHAHADTFNFELRIDQKPFIVDTGTSTYEIGHVRNLERSTKAHNTVEIFAQNSSDVWAGFRVAERAEVLKSEESERSIQATHNGYKKFEIVHTRTFEFEEKKIIIKDTLNKPSEAKAYIHFHPNVDEAFIQKHVKVHDALLKMSHYEYAFGFNKRAMAKCLEIDFKEHLMVEIIL